MTTRIDAFKDILSKRRSEYALGAEWVAPQHEVEEMIAHMMRTLPTHFNAQPVRTVLLTGEAHSEHWRIIESILLERIGEERYNKGTRAKIESSFASGVGTVLFFDDTEITNTMMEKFPAYAANFPLWAQQVQGSHQLAVWLGLTGLGFGSSLQHYTGMDDDKVRKQVQAPDSWSFIAHMPFGKIISPAEAKERKPIQELFKVIN